MLPRPAIQFVKRDWRFHLSLLKCWLSTAGGEDDQCDHDRRVPGINHHNKGAETSRCRDTCVTRDDHSADNEPSSAAPMTTVIMIRVGNDQICVIITAGKGDDHSDDSCGR